MAELATHLAELTGIGGKIIKKDGAIGLIAVILVIFLVVVVYLGQEKTNRLLEDHKEFFAEHTEILKDIRFTLKAGKGITFRNDASFDSDVFDLPAL